MNILEYMSPSILCAMWHDLHEWHERKCPKDEMGKEDWIKRREVMRSIRKAFDGNVGEKEWRKYSRLAKQGKY